MFNHSVTLLAGLIVLTVAIIVVVVALTILAPGLPQSILLSVAFAGVSIGGFAVMKSLVYIARDLISPKMKEHRRVKSAISIGIGFTGFGLAAKLGAAFIPGGYGNLLGPVGSSAYSRGSQTALASFSHYLYSKYFRSEKVARGEALTLEETLKEAQKLHYISLAVTLIGVGLVILGVLLAIAGTLFLAGIPAVIAIVLAPPLISIGITAILQSLLHSSVSKWRTFFTSQQNQVLFVGTSLKSIRDQEWNWVNEVKESKEEEPSMDVQASIEIEIPEENLEAINATSRISSEEVEQRLALTMQQKIFFAIATLLLLAGVAALMVSGFGGLTALQILLVATIGSAVASTTFPMVSSGLAYTAYQLKTRLRISRLRWKEAKNKSYVRNFLAAAGSTYTDKEFNDAWQKVYKKQVRETDAAIRQEVRNFEMHKEGNSVIVGGILIGVGVGIMLLALVPVFTPIIPGLLTIGGAALAIGGGILMQKLVDWLYKELIKLRNRRRKCRECLYNPNNITSGGLDSIAADILVEAMATSQSGLFQETEEVIDADSIFNN
ncbi:hypothetical protein Cs308_0088 [Candidatus Chlamydia sanziniae]|uniref:Uncharacterized protein n=2 Tax=Candidatus Chlamydia sanziniae TaxID=1806891 RepID=A0A1A9HTE4_9CHLA|nr:hypothetical protein Cs308_0088 [Candidatus Chlamydia sanziniae]